jgi:hypothetical protein
VQRELGSHEAAKTRRQARSKEKICCFFFVFALASWCLGGSPLLRDMGILGAGGATFSGGGDAGRAGFSAHGVV